jgi:hypothetical protein
MHAVVIMQSPRQGSVSRPSNGMLTARAIAYRESEMRGHYPEAMHGVIPIVCTGGSA